MTSAADPQGSAGGGIGPTVEFRARSGRWLTWATALLCAGSWVYTLVQQPGDALRYAAVYAVPAVLVWAILGRPAVVVSDGGVELRNVLRTVHLPWTAIQRIDTKYALTLYTVYGTFAAWAAPAPGRMQVLNADPGDLKHLPESTYSGGVRPGDLITSPSGEAAAHVRRRWEELRDAGFLDDQRLEADRPRVRWHTVPGLGVALLTALALLSLRL